MAHRFPPLLLLFALVLSFPAVAQQSEAARWVEQGNELLGEGSLVRAAEAYERAISLDPMGLRGYLGLSATLLKLGDSPRALALLGKAESLVGWSPTLGAQIGVHLAALRRYDEAAAALERVVARDKSSFEAALYLGDVNLRRGRWADAASALDLYLGARPPFLAARDNVVRTRIAYAYLQAGRPAYAERELKATLAAQPSDAAARLLLGIVMAATGRCAEALPIFDELADFRVGALGFDRALCLARLGRTTEASEALGQYEFGHPGEPRTAALRAELAVATGDLDRAVESYRAALGGGEPVALPLASLLVRRGDAAGALAIIWPVAEESGDADALLVATVAALAVHDADRAVSASTRLLQRRPDDRRALLLRGKAALLAGAWDDAEVVFSSVLGQDHKNLEATRGLRITLERRADARRQAGDLDGAYADLAGAHEVEPGAAQVAHNLALLAVSRGEPNRAIAVLTPPPTSLADRLVLGEAHALLGDQKRALALLAPIHDDAQAAPEIRAAAYSAHAALIREAAPEDALDFLARARKLPDLSAATAETLRITEGATLLRAGEESLFAGHEDVAVRHLRAAAAAAGLPEEITSRAQVGLWLAMALGGKGGPAARPAPTTAALERTLAVGIGQGGLDYLTIVAALFGENSGGREYAVQLKAAKALLAAPLGKRRGAVDDLIQAWTDRVIYSAAGRKADAAVVLRDTAGLPRSGASTNNIAVAGWKPGTAGAFDGVPASVPEGLVNQAIAAGARGEHAVVRDRLKKAEAAHVSVPGLADWLSWVEVFRGE